MYQIAHKMFSWAHDRWACEPWASYVSIPCNKSITSLKSKNFIKHKLQVCWKRSFEKVFVFYDWSWYLENGGNFHLLTIYILADHTKMYCVFYWGKWPGSFPPPHVINVQIFWKRWRHPPLDHIYILAAHIHWVLDMCPCPAPPPPPHFIIFQISWKRLRSRNHIHSCCSCEDSWSITLDKCPGIILHSYISSLIKYLENGWNPHP